MTYPRRFFKKLSRGHWWDAPLRRGGVGSTTIRVPLGVDSKLPLPLYVDVRLHIPMTRLNDTQAGAYFGDCDVRVFRSSPSFAAGDDGGGMDLDNCGETSDSGNMRVWKEQALLAGQ